MSTVRAALVVLVTAGLIGCGGAEERKVLAERRAAAAGYRLEHFPQERLLFIHSPNGEKRGIDLTTLKAVFLHRMDARDSVDGKANYFWYFRTPEIAVPAPFFSADPNVVAGILERELPGFDKATALKMTTAFGNNRGGYCLLWATAEYLKETRSSLEKTCRP